MSTEFMLFKKVITIPELPCDPNTIYLVSTANPDMFKILVSNKTGTVLKDVTGSEYIKSMVVSLMASTDSGIDWQSVLLKGNGGDYVWSSQVSPFALKGYSLTNIPSYGVWDGGNRKGMLFSPTTNNEVDVEFTIGHDFALDKPVIPNIHFLPTTNESGVVRWGIEYSVAKVNEVYPASTTVYVDYSVASNSFKKHLVAEVSTQDVIPASLLDIDAVIKCRIFRDSESELDTYPSNVHAWQSVLKYQRARVGTKNRNSNFFN